MKKRAFISFDYDHDEELKQALIGQAKNPDSPFSINDIYPLHLYVTIKEFICQ